MITESEKEGYTAERLEREHRIQELFDQMREFCECEVPGIYSSDGILNAACTIYGAELIASKLAARPTRLGQGLDALGATREIRRITGGSDDPAD